MKKRSIFYGALMLTVGSIALRVMQMLFQIYISRVMGAEGLGRMQLVSTIGGFWFILASCGVRIAAACLTAQEVGMGDHAAVRGTMRCCVIFSLALSLPVGSVLFLLSDMISVMFISQPEAALSLRIFACSLPITTLWSCFAGYFTAEGRVGELVALELMERLLSILIVFLGVKQGVSDPCALIFFASTATGCVSLVLLLGRYFTIMPKIAPRSIRSSMGKLLKLTVPLGLSDILRSALNMIENILIPRGLRMGGASSSHALAVYGTITGMVFPVITFPSVILFSVSDLLVPEMAKCRAKSRQERLNFLTDKCLRLTLVFACACGGLGLLLGKPLGELLFQSQDAGSYIRIFSPLILMLYLDTITDGMLKGLSQQLYTVRYNTLTNVLDVVFLFLLVPRLGIRGYIITFTLTHFVNFLLSIRRLLLTTGSALPYAPLGKSILCLAGSLTAMALIPIRIESSWLHVCLFGGVFLILFLILCFLTGAVNKEDAGWLRRLVKNEY